MGFTGKANANTSDHHQNWGMGFLFVFFPEEQQENKKKNPPFSSSKLTANSSTHLLSRAQSTISICALLIFITLLLFTLSTFEPSSNSNSNSSSHFTSRRQLSQFSSSNSHNDNRNNKYKKFTSSSPISSHALQGMGSLYRRGTKSMNDLIVAHVLESLNLHEFKLFLRLFFLSSLNSRADLLFIFPTKSASFDEVIREENDSFFKLVADHKTLSSMQNSINSTRKLEVPHFLKWSKKDKGSGEPIWGGRIRSNFSGGGNQTESTRLSYGSVVGFDVDELDPDNSLAGFLEHTVPMNLRRWACYPMLLGRVRRNFKHIILVDVKELLLVGDPLSRLRSWSPESVHLSTVTQSATTRHGKKNLERTQSSHPKSVNPGMIKGGARGVRRLSHAMLNEIVRGAVQKKKKNSVTEFGLFNQLVGNEFLLKNVKLITSPDSIPELSSVAGSNSKPGSSSPSISNFTVVRRGNSNFDVNSTVLKHILCSSQLQNSVYSNCL